MNTIVLSVLSGLGGMVGWGVYDFLAGVYAKRIGPHKVLFWSQSTGLLVSLGLLAILRPPVDLPAFAILLLLPPAAASYCGGYLFFTRALQIGNISLVAAIMNLWAVFAMLLAFVFLGQRLSAVQTVGVVIILAGVSLTSVNWADLLARRLEFTAGVKETVLGAFCFGVFFNISDVISGELGWLSTTLAVKAQVVVFLLLLARIAGRDLDVRRTGAGTKAMIIVMGVIETGGIASVNFGLTIGDAILISPIASALSIVTIGMAVLFLKDRVSRLQGLGITTAVAGIVVTAF